MTAASYRDALALAADLSVQEQADSRDEDKFVKHDLVVALLGRPSTSD